MVNKLKQLHAGVLLFLAVCLVPVAPAVGQESGSAIDKSDLNGDGVIDTTDLVLFSSRYLEQSFDDVDWCLVYEAVAAETRVYGKLTKYFQKHFRLLMGFVYDQYHCAGGPLLLALVNEPARLVRVAVDQEHTGNYYISDPGVGSVFIYDPARVLIGELKNLDRPLGVAIDSFGYLLVANDGRDNIEVYDPANGDLLAEFGQDLLEMPTSVTIGPDQAIYVTDSEANCVWVFEPSYLHVRTIGGPGVGQGQFKFPTDTAVIIRDQGGTPVQEVYVADQFNRRIQVFDTAGSYLRVIEPLMIFPSFCGFFGVPCPEAKGTFTRLQALDFDALGRLHSLDIYEAKVVILDPVSGALIDTYAAWGDGPGLVRTPLDLWVDDLGQALITDAVSTELEVFTVPGG